MKREENMKYWEKNSYSFIFFNILKKFIKNSNNIPSISKTIQHTPMTWCTYLQSFEKIHWCIFELVRKLNVTDGRTDRPGGIAILPSRAFGAAGDKNACLAIWGLGGPSIIGLGPSCFPAILSPRSIYINYKIWFWFYWMFHDHFSARSPLAKLGRWGWSWGWGWLERKSRRH